MELQQVKKIFDELFKDVDGKSLSLKGREQEELKSKSFVYGEVVPHSFYTLIKDLNPQPGQVFYDLGSGTGKAVILAQLLFEFSKIVGIELVHTLYEASEQMYKRYQEKIVPKIAKEIEGRKIELIEGDFLKMDISDADIVFMNSTCFQEDLMTALADKLECLRPNAHVISLSKPVKSPYFHQYKHLMYEFSWGQATAFYHRKRLWKVYG